MIFRILNWQPLVSGFSLLPRKCLQAYISEPKLTFSAEHRWNWNEIKVPLTLSLVVGLWQEKRVKFFWQDELSESVAYRKTVFTDRNSFSWHKFFGVGIRGEMDAQECIYIQLLTFIFHEQENTNSIFIIYFSFLRAECDMCRCLFTTSSAVWQSTKIYYLLSDNLGIRDGTPSKVVDITILKNLSQRKQFRAYLLFDAKKNYF